MSATVSEEGDTPQGDSTVDKPDLENRSLTREQREQLVSHYDVERQDDMQSVIIGIALVTIGVTYVVTAIAFTVSQYKDDEFFSTPLWLQLSAPLVTTGIFGYFVVNYCASRIRSRLLFRLELLLSINPDGADTRLIGSALPSFRTETSFIFEAKPRGVELLYFINRFVNVLLWVAVGVGFTVFCLVLGPWSWWKLVAAIAYGAVHLVQVAALVGPFFYERFTNRPIL